MILIKIVKKSLLIRVVKGLKVFWMIKVFHKKINIRN